MLGVKAWLSRIFWKIRGRRVVRVQLLDDRGAVDGILIGTVAGHYVLANASFISQKPGSAPVEMLGNTWIPKERVILLNVRS